MAGFQRNAAKGFHQVHYGGPGVISRIGGCSGQPGLEPVHLFLSLDQKFCARQLVLTGLKYSGHKTDQDDVSIRAQFQVYTQYTMNYKHCICYRHTKMYYDCLKFEIYRWTHSFKQIKGIVCNNSSLAMLCQHNLSDMLWLSSVTCCIPAP